MLTGLLLQLASGPVFFFIVSVTVQKSLWHGLAGVLVATLVHFFCIAILIIGFGGFIDGIKKSKYLEYPRVIFLAFIAFIFFQTMFFLLAPLNLDVSELQIFSAFLNAFAIAAFNPMTIINYTALIAVKSRELKKSKKDLIIWGSAVGLATLFFMGYAAIAFSYLRQSLPDWFIDIANAPGLLLLIVLGLTRVFKNKNRKLE